MKKYRYKCHIMTQGGTQSAERFSIDIETRVNDLIQKKNLLESPICIMTSDANGRKEVLIQWTEPELISE